MKISIQYDDRALKDLLSGLRRELQPRVIAAAINDTAKHVKAKSSTDIRQKFAIKKADLDRHIAINKASPVKLEAVVSVAGEPIPVMKFGARQIRKGVSFKILKAGGRKVLRRGFIAKMPSGHTGVFRRAGTRRLPIIEQKVVTPPTMWKQIIGKVKDDAGDFLLRRLQARVGLAVRKK